MSRHGGGERDGRQGGAGGFPHRGGAGGSAAGALAIVVPIAYPVREGVRFGAYTMLFGCAFASAGAQLAMFSLLASAFCDNIGLSGGLRLARREALPEIGILAGAAMTALGAAGCVWSLFVWAQTDVLDLETRMRVAVPSATLFICGTQMAFSAFFLALLRTQGGADGGGLRGGRCRGDGAALLPPLAGQSYAIRYDSATAVR